MGGLALPNTRDFAPNVPRIAALDPPDTATPVDDGFPSFEPVYTGMAAMELTGERDFDSMILGERDQQSSRQFQQFINEQKAAGNPQFQDYIYGLPGGKPGVMQVGINAEGTKGANYQEIPYSTPEEYINAYNIKLNTPAPPESWRNQKRGFGLGQILSIAASIAIPFAAPALAGALATSTGIAALGGTAGAALTGAALGAGKAAIFDEDIATGALLGGVSGGVAGALGGAGAGTEAAGAAAGGPQPLTMAELVGGTSPAAGTVNIGAGLPGGSLAAAAPSITAGAPLTAANVFGGGAGVGGMNVGLVDTLTQQAAANLTGAAAAGAPLTAVAPGAVNLGAGLAPDVAAALPAPATTTLVPSTTAPVPEIIPEVSPFDTAGGEFVQTGGLQQSPVPTPVGTYDPATGLTGYIDQTGQFVQTASPVATPTGIELATGAAPAATAAQSPVFGVADLAAPTFGATGAMVAPIAGSVAGAPVAPSLLGGAPRAPGAQDAVIEAGLDYTGPQVGAVTGTGATAPVVAGGTAPAGSLASITPPVPGSVMAPAATGPLNAARNYIGSVGSNLVSGVTGAFAPNRVADLILRGAGLLAVDALGGGDGSSALAGLSAEEQALVLDMRDELAKAQQEDENLFNERLQQAYSLIGDVDYFDPEYFGLQSARRAQLQAARAKQAGLRGLTGEERAAEARRYDLETGRSTGTAYDVGYGTGLEARMRARQAGIEAMPTSYPARLTNAYAGLSNIYSTGAAEAARASAQRRDSIAGLFGGLFGSQPEEDTNPQTAGA